MATRISPAGQKPAAIPPSTVRIKRKRNQDPLAALLLNDQTKKKSRTDSFVFKFAGTVDDQSFKDGDLLKESHSQLNLTRAEDAENESQNINGQRVFRFAKTKKQQKRPIEDTIDLPDSLSDMIKNYLQIESEESSNIGNQPAKPEQDYTRQEPSLIKRPSGRRVSQIGPKPPITTLKDNDKSAAGTKDGLEGDDDEYVYDIYYREVVTSGYQYEGPNIGFILFDDDDQEAFKNNEEYDSEREFLTDDEDSNAEDFYKNDYPDEESNASDDGSADEFAFSSLDRNADVDLHDSDSDNSYGEVDFDDDDDGYGYNGRKSGFGEAADIPQQFNGNKRGSDYMGDDDDVDGELDFELNNAMNDDDHFDDEGGFIGGEDDEDNMTYRRASAAKLTYRTNNQQVNADAIEGDWSEDEWDQYRDRLFGKLTELVENDK